MIDDERDPEPSEPEATSRAEEPTDVPVSDAAVPEAGDETHAAAATDAGDLTGGPAAPSAPPGAEASGRDEAPEEPTRIGPLGPAAPEQGKEPTTAGFFDRAAPLEAVAGPDSTVYAGRAEPGAARADAAVGGLSTTIGNFAPRSDSRAIRVGDVLNNSYRVTRFIARGGMGEVFEGVNVLSEERVAIKVILPSLAADVNVIELFKKEAQTLTRLAHDALVRYRQIAQSKELGVIYLVTEYIDGTNLADVLGSVKPGEGELVDLLRRLASGLAVAHDCGAVHRDLSPDNVILEGGSLSRPKIVDFGIAKNLDPGSRTIVGDSFAGKLNFVAPEQLGAYEGRVGPAADIYSLGLTMLAVIGGRPVPMGGSLVEAVRKRETLPDLAAAPPSLRPVLAKMLQPDPSDRYQTMREVVAALAGGGGHDVRPPRPGPRQPWPSLPRPLLIGGGAVLLAGLVALAVVALTGGGGEDPAEAADQARMVVDQAVPTIPCSWLSVAEVGAGTPPTVRMTGVARSPRDADSRLDRALMQADVAAKTDVDGVAIILPEGCSALDTFGEIRKPGQRYLTADAPDFERSRSGDVESGKPVAIARITFNPPPTKDFTLFGIEPLGTFSPLIANRADLAALVEEEARQAHPRVIRTASGGYQLNLRIDHVGWSGLVLIAGDGPFDPALTQPLLAARTAAWQRNFRATASERNWTSEMLWFRSVDRNPND